MNIYYDKTINTLYIDESPRQIKLQLSAGVDVEEVASFVKTEGFKEIISQLTGEVL